MATTKSETKRFEERKRIEELVPVYYGRAIVGLPNSPNSMMMPIQGFEMEECDQPWKSARSWDSPKPSESATSPSRSSTLAAIPPAWQQKKLLDYCKSKGIVMTAFSPLRKGEAGDPMTPWREMW
ncbi:hypothetical protein K1719_023927 [Acacia pycnantha]|nr:hypothetical protein K1719_023927 [Acacia pycnantha]